MDHRLEEEVRAALDAHGALFDIDGDGTVGPPDIALVQRLVRCELATRPESRLADPTLPVQPQLVEGRWRLVGVLGRGGQATTYLGRDEASSGAWVAVKELDLGRVDDWKAIELFEREAQALEQLEHPSIPSYIAHFSVQEGEHVRFFLVQQFVHGADLKDELHARGALDEASAAKVRDAVFDILEYLHGQQPPIVHRDIKPSNLLRMADGRIVLVDFGAVQSKQAATVGGSTIVGTTGYMPTEQYMGRAVPASDLYALGATLVHLMSGVHPGELAVRENRLVIDQHVSASAPFMNGLHALLEPAVERRVPNVASARAAFQTAMTAPERDAEPAPKRRFKLLPVAIGVMILAYAIVWGYREFFADPRDHFSVDNIYDAPPANAKRVLFVGNSHTYWEEQPAVVARMVPEGQPPLWFEAWGWPGADVKWHVEHRVERVLEEQPWDHIVLQPQSVEPASSERYFAEWLGRYEQLLPEGADSIVWVPKARHPEYDVYGIYKQAWSGGSHGELTNRLEKGVRAWVSQSRICPIGRAWAKARTDIPKAPLYRTEDGNKAAPAGVYLTGLMLYGCIYQRDPAEVTWVSAALTEGAAEKLRKVASATWRNHRAEVARAKGEKVPKLKGLKGMKMKIDF